MTEQTAASRLAFEAVHRTLSDSAGWKAGLPKFDYREAEMSAKRNGMDLIYREELSRYTVRGTHEGEFFGVAGTGNRVEFTGIQIDRFDESGKMVEEWPEYDLLRAMRQLGAISDPEQAASS
jgi:SnoaL-like polyketide cyclase